MRDDKFAEIHAIAVEQGRHLERIALALLSLVLALGSAGAIVLNAMGDTRLELLPTLLIYAPLFLAFTACLMGFATRLPVVPNPNHRPDEDGKSCSALEGLGPWHCCALVASNENAYRGKMIAIVIAFVFNAIFNLVAWTGPGAGGTNNFGELWDQNEVGLTVTGLLAAGYLLYLILRLCLQAKPRVGAVLRSREIISVESRRRNASHYLSPPRSRRSQSHLLAASRPTQREMGDAISPTPGADDAVLERRRRRALRRVGIAAAACAVACVARLMLILRRSITRTSAC